LTLLDDRFQEFKDNMEECQKTIKRCQALLRKDVEDQMEDFKKDCIDLKNNFKTNAPTSYDKENKQKSEENVRSFDKLADYKNQTIFLRGREEDLKFGLEIFDLEQGSYPEITLVETEIEYLNDMWAIKRDWDNKWDSLKEVQFYQLPVQDIMMDAYEVRKAMKEMPKDVKDFALYEMMTSELSKFIEMCPLIESLQHEAMRPRHWKDLRLEVKDDFDERADEFNLERIYALNLLQYQEKVWDLTDNAKKQLTIEKGLINIDKMWTRDPKSSLRVESGVSRADQSTYYYIDNTGDIMQLIEDHGGDLGTYKSSPYYREFQDEIDLWESNIARVTETLEALMTVQKLWQYLE